MTCNVSSGTLNHAVHTYFDRFLLLFVSLVATAVSCLERLFSAVTSSSTLNLAYSCYMPYHATSDAGDSVSTILKSNSLKMWFLSWLCNYILCMIEYVMQCCINYKVNDQDLCQLCTKPSCFMLRDFVIVNGVTTL